MAYYVLTIFPDREDIKISKTDIILFLLELTCLHLKTVFLGISDLVIADNC